MNTKQTRLFRTLAVLSAVVLTSACRPAPPAQPATRARLRTRPNLLHFLDRVRKRPLHRLSAIELRLANLLHNHILNQRDIQIAPLLGLVPKPSLQRIRRLQRRHKALLRREVI